MKYKRELDHELIKEQLNEAERLQLSTYKGHIDINKTPIVITAVMEWESYRFCFESNPELGKEEYHSEFPAYTTCIVAVLRPVI